MSTSPDPVPPPSAPPLGEPTLAALCDTVREALAKATPGPWQCWNGWGPPAGAMADERAMTRIGPAGDYWGGVRGFVGIPGKMDGDLYARKADAELVAQAPTWLARLVDGVRELQNQLNSRRDGMDENTTAKAQIIEPGHYLRDGWFFFRLPTGAVRIRKHLTADPTSKIVEELEIPGEQWCSIVTATSRDGESGVTYGLANALHWGTCRAD